MAKLKTSDGTEIEYLIQGSPEADTTHIFLHGWCSNGFEWLPYARELPEDIRSLCWNARGHGHLKIQRDCDMSLDRMAEDLRELILKESPQGVFVTGHSMGALTLWRYIQRHGCDLLKGLCIVDQSPKLLTDDSWSMGVYGNFDNTRNQFFCRRLTQDFAETVVQLIFDGLNDSSKVPDNNYVKRLREYLSQMPGDKLKECWISLTDADLRTALANISVPSLLIYGDRSQFYGPQLARWVHQHIDGSQLIRYSEADHSPHITDKDRFIKDLSGFLNSMTGLPLNQQQA